MFLNKRDVIFDNREVPNLFLQTEELLINNKNFKKAQKNKQGFSIIPEFFGLFDLIEVKVGP